MVCIYCGGNTEVINSRLQKKANRVWRRRRCRACGAVFTSQEQIVYDGAFVVQEDTSHIVPFSRDLLYLSLYDACRHRRQAVTDAGALTDTTLSRLIPTAKSGVIERQNIVATCQAVLKNFDKAAAMHYEAFHTTNPENLS